MAQVTHSLALADTYPKRKKMDHWLWNRLHLAPPVWTHIFNFDLSLPMLCSDTCGTHSVVQQNIPKTVLPSARVNIIHSGKPVLEMTAVSTSHYAYLMFYCYWARAVTAMQGRAQNAQEQHNLLEAPQKAINFLRHDSTAIIKYM